MSPSNPLAGWNATDDDVSVPVRSSNAPAAPAADLHAMDMTHGEADHIVLRHHAASVNPASMRLSAFLGVALVLGAIGFHFGFGNIFGDLSGGATPTVVEITPEGVFSPNTITLSPGDTMMLENKNPDPQVIKSKDGRELFAVQVLFDTPFTFTVPSNAFGTYTYFSETLPDDKTLTITIAAGATSSSVDSADIPIPFGGEEIPIPFGNNEIPIPFGNEEIPIPFGNEEIPIPFGNGSAGTVSSSSSSFSSSFSSSSSSSSTTTVTEHTGGSTTISLGGNRYLPRPSSSAPSFRSQIPTNPYTVTTGLETQDRLEAIAAAAKATQEIHAGAPLQEMVKHKPTSVTKTGPEGMLLLVLPAFMGVALLFRKLSVA